MKMPSNRKAHEQNVIVFGRGQGSEPLAGVFPPSAALEVASSLGQGFQVLYDPELIKQTSALGLKLGEMEGEKPILHRIEEVLFEKLSSQIKGNVAREELSLAQTEAEEEQSHERPSERAHSTPKEQALTPLQLGSTVQSIIVFGKGEAGRPRAGWYSRLETPFAKDVAQRQGLRVLSIRTPEVRALATLIKRGKLFGLGNVYCSSVTLAIHERLSLLAKSDDSGASTNEVSSTGATGVERPKNWEEVGVGSLVLALDDDSWWEAEVLASFAGEFLLRWKESPDEETLIRTLDQIALKNPLAID